MSPEMLLLKAEKARVEELEFYIESLEEKLITAKRAGAVEELRRLAKEWQKDRPGFIYPCNILWQRADELEGKNG